MTLRQRRILFAFFIILFFIIVPFVLLYATGQRINWRKLSLERTSTLIVDSTPAGATVTLNGRRAGMPLEWAIGRAPAVTKARVTGLAPGEYTVRLEKEGYLPWETRLNIAPGEAANIGIIRLLRDGPAEVLAAETALAPKATFSPNGQRLLLLARDAAAVLTVADGKKLSFAVPLLPDTTEISWSAAQDKVMIGDRVLDTVTGTTTNLSTIIKKASGSPRWDPADNNLVYYFDSQQLQQLDLRTQTTRPLADVGRLLAGRRLADYEFRSGTVYLVAEDAVGTDSLVIFNVASGRENTTDLPAGQYRFVMRERNEPLLHDKENRRLHIIEEPLPLLQRYRLAMVADNFQTGIWEGPDFIYSTPFEIRRWSRNDSQTALLARLSLPVIALSFLPESDYLAYATPEAVSLRPRQDNPFMLTFDIIRPENVKAFMVSPDSRWAYVYGAINGQAGLFRLPI